MLKLAFKSAFWVDPQASQRNSACFLRFPWLRCPHRAQVLLVPRGSTATTLSPLRALPLELSEDIPAHDREFFEYYRPPRGQHPRSTTRISPRPSLFIAGEEAFSLPHTQEAFARAAVTVPGARHIDLYAGVNFIPWDKLRAFFTQHLGRVDRAGVPFEVPTIQMPGDSRFTSTGAGPPFFSGVHLHGGLAPVRRPPPELIELVLEGKIEPGLVSELTLPPEQGANGDTSAAPSRPSCVRDAPPALVAGA